MKKPERPDSVKKPESIKKLKQKVKPSPPIWQWWVQFTNEN